MNRILLPIISLLLSCALSLRGQGQLRQQDAGAEIAGRAIVPSLINNYRMPDRSRGGFSEAKPTLLDIPASNAKVELIYRGDTLKTTTDQVGSFSFKNLTQGPVHLSIDYLDYEPFSETFELLPGENVIVVSFQKKTETLDAAVVQDEMPVVTMRGDTLIYHAAAVAQLNGDFAIDLLRRFPGVEVKDGQIIVTGKNVKRTYVNGALIFGLNPMDSMEYLKAEDVVTMNVYDETDPEEIRDGIAREKQRVIDIITKNSIFNAVDLQVRALAGLDQQPMEDGSAQSRYGAGANAHFFSELEQLQVDVMTSNVGMRSSTINMTPGPLSTYLDNKDLKLGYNHYWVSPLFGNALQTSYSLSHDLTRRRRHSLQDYFETAGIPGRTQDNESSAVGKIRTHQMQVYYNHRTGKHIGFTWNHFFRHSKGTDDRLLSEQITVSHSDPMIREERSRSDNRSWNLTESFDVSLISSKPLPSFTFEVDLGSDNLDSWELDTLASSYSKRYLTKAGNGLSQKYSASVRQMLLNSSEVRGGEIRAYQLQGNYRVSYSTQDRIQEAYDLYSTPSPIVNVANTYDFTYSSLLNSIYLQLIARPKGNLSITAGLTAQAERVTDRERIPASEPYGKTFFNIMPLLGISGRQLSFSLNSITMTPAVEQLRRRINDTNPLSLIAGNPELKQSTTYTVSLQNRSVNRASKHVVTWGVNAQFEKDPIVNKTIFYPTDTVLDDYDGYYVRAGSTVMMAENSDHAYNLRGNMLVSSQWGGKWKAVTSFSPTISYRSQPQYFGEVLDRTGELTPALSAEGSVYPWKNASFGFDADVAYIRAKNQAGTFDRHAVRARAGINMRIDFLKYAFFTGDYSLSLYRDLSVESMRNDINRLNLAVGVGLLKDKALKISLRGVDLLRGGSLYNVAVNPSSIIQTWTPVYGRYFLIDITYRFNNTNGRIMNLPF